MNKMLILVLLSSCTRTCKVLSLAHKNEERNLFRDINKCVQNTVNNVFVLLRLNKNFTTVYQNRMLLTMHAFMKSTSENKYRGYSNIKRTVKMSSKHNFKDGFDDHDNLTSRLVREILTPKTANKYSDQANKTGINLPLTSLEIPENWDESIKFLKEYFQDIEGTKTFSIDTPLKMIRNSLGNKKIKAKLRNNLRAWKANNTTEAMQNASDTRRVYKGKNANINRYPFIASVHVRGEFVCAGSIVSKNMILTAATCLHVFLYNKSVLIDNPQRIKVRVGSEYTLQLGHVYKVSHIHFHPRYNVENLHNNLAMLRIDHHLHLKKSKKIRRIVYHRRNMDEYVPDKVRDVVMLGWGDKGPKISGAFESLSFSHLKMYDQERCMDAYSRKYVSIKNFCAGFIHKGSGACQRDVGGPAIIGDLLVGVVSFGPPVCGTPDAPTVFTNISHYTTWIDSIVKKKSLIVTSTILPALLQPKYENEKRHYEEESEEKFLAHKKKPTAAILRSQHEAIKIVKDFLKKLTNGGNNIDDMLYEANDNLGEGSDEGIVVDADNMPEDEQNEQPLKEETNRTTMRIDKKEYGDGLQTNEPVTNDKVMSINTSEIVQSVVSGLRNEYIKSKIASGSEDPFFLAMKSLGSYLGLDKFIQLPQPARYRTLTMTEHTDELEVNKIRSQDRTLFATTSGFAARNPTAKLETDSLENMFRTNIYTEVTANAISNSNKQNKQIEAKEIKYIFSPEESDNYESESQGMSIEVKQVGIDPVQRAQTEKNNAETAYAYETQTLQEYHDKAQIFLNKNFVNDVNASLTNIDVQANDEELVVLHIKTTTDDPTISSSSSNKEIRHNELDRFKLRVKTSHFSVVSNFNSSSESMAKNAKKSKIEIELPPNVVQTVSSNKIPIAQLRSVDNDGNDTVKEDTYTDISTTNEGQILSTYVYNLTTTQLPTTIHTHITTKAPVITTTANNTPMINTRTLVVLVTESTLHPSTDIEIPINKTNNVSDTRADDAIKSTTEIPIITTMAAYESNEKRDYEYDGDDDDDAIDDTDLEVRRRVLDYINIT